MIFISLCISALSGAKLTDGLEAEWPFDRGAFQQFCSAEIESVNEEFKVRVDSWVDLVVGESDAESLVEVAEGLVSVFCRNAMLSSFYAQNGLDVKLFSRLDQVAQDKNQDLNLSSRAAKILRKLEEG